MGNSASYNDDGAPEYDEDPFDGADTLGYRVLGVQPESPASQAGLVSFLDFLLGVNGKMLLGSGEDLQEGEEYDDVDLPALLQEHVNQEIEFLVYNIKSGEARLVKLTPRDNWGGAGLLGVTIRLDNYAGAEERLIRVLTVEPKSPAAVAGLVPEKDFVLGTTHATLDSADSLATLLHNHVDQVVEFYVYNTDSDLVRTVVLMPTLSWGGQGLLGAEVGTGYLHRLPRHSRTTDGASVVRKVRYVQKPATTTAAQSTSTSNTVSELQPSAVATVHDEKKEREASHATASRAAPPAAAAPAPTAVLEYEPQLEMEVADDEEEEEEEEEGHASSAPLPPPPLQGRRTTQSASNARTFTQPLPPPPQMSLATP